MGEIKVFNSQMPGAQTDALQFMDGHIDVGGSWQTFNGSPLVDPYYSNFRYYAPVAGVDLNIWDHDRLANG